MSRAIMKFRPRVPSNAFTIEPLEQRQVLSVALAPGIPSPSPVDPPEPVAVGLVAARNSSLQSLLSVSPGDGAVLPASSAPSAIVVHLNGAVIHNWINGGITLYRMGAEGDATPFFLGEQPPDAIVDFATNTVTIPLETALGPGRYRVVLLGGAGSFSRPICDGSWDYMADQTLAEFTVAEREGGADSTVDAGVVGSTPQSFNGALGVANDRVDYKVTLGADRPLWRLGLQLDAERIGSDLLATLTVRDAAGNVVASSEGRRGLASTPNDPYLFAGLQPGSYYVTVAATGGGGSYRLGIVADPVTAPTRVTGFALDWTNGAPTGFTIEFSDAIAPESLATTSAPVWAVDAGGGIHPAVLSAADDGLRRLSFVFDQPLAPGEYQLVRAGGGELVDLVGRAPTADGSPGGSLATWTVAPYQQTSNDPEPPASSWLDGAHLESLIDNAVGSGGALALRFGASVGATAPSPTTSDPTPTPAVTAAGSTPSFIGVLDSSLFGRPEPRSNDASPSVGPIPARGVAMLVSASRERLAGNPPASSWGDDGLIRSPDGLPEIDRPAAEPTETRLVEFPRGRRDRAIVDGARADVDILAQIETNHLADSAAALARWLFGPSTPVPDLESDRLDAQMIAQLDAEAEEAVPVADRAREQTSRASLGVPIGALILAAVAYRLHRHPPRWWRRRRPAGVEAAAAARHPAVPRGPRFMIPRRAGAASRKVPHR